MEEATICFTVSLPERVLSKNVLKRVSLKQTFCDVCEDILHDIEVSDIGNQALDYRKLDVSLSESVLGTTDDFKWDTWKVTPLLVTSTLTQICFLKLNIDTKCQSGETESKKNAFTVLMSSAVVQNTKRPVKIPEDGLRFTHK